MDEKLPAEGPFNDKMIPEDLPVEDLPAEGPFEDKIDPETVPTEQAVKKLDNKHFLVMAVIAIAVAAFFGGYIIGTEQNPDVSIKRTDLSEFASSVDASSSTQQPGSTKLSFDTIPSVSIDDDPVKGNPDAPVTIVEFSDFQCPFCKRFFDQTLPLLEQDYIDTGKVKLVYRDFPIEKIHPNAVAAHLAAECADDQGSFWEYHDVLFGKQGQWANLGLQDALVKFQQFSLDLGLDSEKFDDCFLTLAFLDEIKQDYFDAVGYGADGTPTFFIGNDQNGFVVVKGAIAYPIMKDLIDYYLEL